MSRLCLRLGDCIEQMRQIPDNSVHLVATDPPYNFEGGVMGKAWDRFATPAEFQEFSRQWGTEALRILRPGGYVTSFCSTKQYHRMACGLEDAGFMPKDMISWVYSSGMPKSYDVGQAIEKLQTTGKSRRPDRNLGLGRRHTLSASLGQAVADTGGKIPLTVPDALRWAGHGTALCPAQEPIFIGQKPLAEKNYAANVLRHGAGVINVDASRIHVPFNPEDPRFPKNVLHDGSPEVLAVFGNGAKNPAHLFYCPKPNQREKTHAGRVENTHVTVKPEKLLAYLIRMFCPAGGIVVDPFLGSGTAAVAAIRLGYRFYGIEREPEYMQIAQARARYTLEELRCKTNMPSEGSRVSGATVPLKSVHPKVPVTAR